MRAGIALGSNVGDRLERLRQALQLLASASPLHPPLLRSAIYETDPVDMPPDTQPFLNAVIEIGTSLLPFPALELLADIERQMGRPERRPRNLSRVIDLDLLYHDDHIVASPRLTLPHPGLTRRAFVLFPLADIRPELVLPGESATVAELLTNLPNPAQVQRTPLTWT